MATLNSTWTPCGSTSDGTYVYYGKTNIVTGTPISGTGWTLYTGAPISNGAGSATISGVDDNVQYSIYTYCHCSAAGNGQLTSAGPVINYACPSLANITPTFNGVSYTLNIPSSANNAGSYITKTLVQLYDSTNTNILQTNTYNSPFTGSVNDSFAALSSSTNYNLRVVYSNTSGSLTNNCVNTPITTSAACVASTVTITSPTSTGFTVNWTPTTGGTFDVLINGTAVATGLTTGPYAVTGQAPATTYQVNVRKNCTTGGNAISTTQNVTTTNASISGTISVLSSVPVTSGSAGTYQMVFTFPTATTFPTTVYFGQGFELTQDNVTFCSAYNGYDIFSISQGSNPQCSANPSEPGYGPSGNLPWVINIPSGVTTYTTPVNSVYTTAGTGSNVGSLNPGGFQYAAWNRSAGASGHIATIRDLFVKIQTPSGYSGNFSYANSANVVGVNLVNV